MKAWTERFVAATRKRFWRKSTIDRLQAGAGGIPRGPQSRQAGQKDE